MWIIWIVLKDMELPILKELPEKQLKGWCKSYAREDSRYSLSVEGLFVFS